MARLLLDPKQIAAALAALHGQPLCGSHRAGDLQVFQFGELREFIRERGRGKGELALRPDWGLHVQCSWRITGPEGIVVARRDLYYRAGDDPDLDWETFDYDRDPNRRTERMQEFLRQHEAKPLRVEAIAADSVGGFRLELSEGCCLEVWPDDSLPGEHWRLLRSENLDSHFVVTGEGIEVLARPNGPSERSGS
ncbi:MAG: hypothetical protein ACK47B_16005 [Armatimonadota bacterium]